MVVEVFIPKKSSVIPEEEGLPDTMLELEMQLKETEFATEKLRESTDLLTEEFRKSEGDEAREYYEYIQDNLEILRKKMERMKRIEDKMNTIRGIFTKSPDVSSSSGAGGLMDTSEFQGHFI